MSNIRVRSCSKTPWYLVREAVTEKYNKEAIKTKLSDNSYNRYMAFLLATADCPLSANSEWQAMLENVDGAWICPVL